MYVRRILSMPFTDQYPERTTSKEHWVIQTSFLQLRCSSNYPSPVSYMYEIFRNTRPLTRGATKDSSIAYIVLRVTCSTQNNH